MTYKFTKVQGFRVIVDVIGGPKPEAIAFDTTKKRANKQYQEPNSSVSSRSVGWADVSLGRSGYTLTLTLRDGTEVEVDEEHPSWLYLSDRYSDQLNRAAAELEADD